MIIHEILLTAQKPKSSQYIHDVELYEHLWAKRYNQPRSPAVLLTMVASLGLMDLVRDGFIFRGLAGFDVGRETWIFL